MPTPCSVCHHPDRAEIDAQLLANVTVRGHQNAVAKRYELTPMAVSRHVLSGHVPGLPGLLARAGPLPTVAGGWQLVLADPPWEFRARSQKGRSRSPERHYATMPVRAITALPVPAVAARDSVLALWATWPHLGDAVDVMRAWGYEPVSGLDWLKTNADGSPWRGLGLLVRPSTELLLLGRRGEGVRLASGPADGLLRAPRREHSRKPDEVFERLERLFGDVRRLELFARARRPGWTAWGLEVDRFPAPARLPEEAAS